MMSLRQSMLRTAALAGLAATMEVSGSEPVEADAFLDSPTLRFTARGTAIGWSEYMVDGLAPDVEHHVCIRGDLWIIDGVVRTPKYARGVPGMLSIAGAVAIA